MSNVSVDPALLREAAQLLVIAAEKVDCSMPHTYNSIATRLREAANQAAIEDREKTMLRKRISAMVTWLEEHQPNVFKSGLWDAFDTGTAP